MQYPTGRKFGPNRSISYGSRDIHTFSFSAKTQDGRQKWRKLKFFPCVWDTLAIPCGSKIRSKSLYLLRFSRYSHFFIFRKNPRWPPKVAKIEIFDLCMGHSSTTLWVENSLEIALFLTVFEIFTLFHFPQKSKMAAKVAKIEIFPFAWDALAKPFGSKIRSKSLYLLRFSRYSHFFIFRKNPRWPPKWRKLKFFPLHGTLLQNPLGRKFARNRSISCGFRDIHTFSFSAKIQDGQQKWRKLKFLPFAWDTLPIPCGSKIRSKSLCLLRFSRYL